MDSAGIVDVAGSRAGRGNSRQDLVGQIVEGGATWPSGFFVVIRWAILVSVTRSITQGINGCGDLGQVIVDGRIAIPHRVDLGDLVCVAVIDVGRTVAQGVDVGNHTPICIVNSRGAISQGIDRSDMCVVGIVDVGHPAVRLDFDFEKADILAKGLIDVGGATTPCRYALREKLPVVLEGRSIALRIDRPGDIAHAIEEDGGDVTNGVGDCRRCAGNVVVGVDSPVGVGDAVDSAARVVAVRGQRAVGGNVRC